MLEKLLVKFAVSKQLPIVGLNFECAIIDFDRENHIILVEDSILPTEVSFIDTNVAKLKTNVENVTYIVMFPTLVSNKTYIGKIETLPYLGDVLKYEEPEFRYVSLNNFSVCWKKYEDSYVKSVKKCSDNVFLVFTDNNMYILMKDSTKTEN